MTNRREFLTRSSIAIAGGLLFGDAALELFERLTHRKVFALGGLHGMDDILDTSSLHTLNTTTLPYWKVAGDFRVPAYITYSFYYE